MRALGYVHVSDGGDLLSRGASIREWCAARAVALATVVHDAGELRPSLAWALEQIDARGAELLVVARLRDLASDVGDLLPLLRWFDAPTRGLVALDLGLDTTSEAGRVAAAAIADLVARADAEPGIGARLRRGRAPGRGRPAVADTPELHDRIAAMREHGMTLQAIADALNEDGIPTVRGGRLWRPSSVQRATGYRRPSAPGRGIELPKRTIR
jgi:DNA invertase Pin-like site-specific DNA recombinase